MKGCEKHASFQASKIFRLGTTCYTATLAGQRQANKKPLTVGESVGKNQHTQIITYGGNNMSNPNQNEINWSTFAGGGMAEKLSRALHDVLKNISNPNTSPTAARKITMTMKLSANKERNLSNVEIEVKSTLAPEQGVETQLLIGIDPQGNIIGNELKSGVPGQTYFDEKGTYTDTGEPIEPEESGKIVKFQ